MKVTWLGQAGLLFEDDNHKILIDPYLSDSCRKVNPASVRRIPVDEKIFEVKPDVLILTHKHLDHTDPETLEKYLNDGEMIVLAPKGSWEIAREFGGKHNYIMFNSKTSVTVDEICFKAVCAEHSDENAIGVIFEMDSKVFYVTGDTLYNDKIFEMLPDKIDVVFLPVNGKGNNLNITDAKKFVDMCGAKKVVPVHWGMFDDLTKEDVLMENALILTPFVLKEM